MFRKPIQIYVCGSGLKPLELPSSRYLEQDDASVPFTCCIYLNKEEMQVLLYNKSGGLNNASQIRSALEHYFTDGPSFTKEGEMHPGAQLRTYVAKSLRHCVAQVFGNPSRSGAIKVKHIIDDMQPGGPLFEHLFDESLSCKEIERDLFCIYESNRYLGEGKNYVPVSGDQVLLQSEFKGSSGQATFEIKFIYDSHRRSTSEGVQSI